LLKGEFGSDALEILEAFEEPFLLDQSLEQVTLGLEVVVDCGVGDACLAGDVADGSTREATLGEEAQGGIENLLAGMRSAACATIAGCGVFCGYGEGPPLSSH